MAVVFSWWHQARDGRRCGGGYSSLLCALQVRFGGLRNVGGSQQWLRFSLFQYELMQVSDLVRSRSQVQADECVTVESSAMATGAQG